MAACAVLAVMLVAQILLPADAPSPEPAGLAARRGRPVAVPPLPQSAAVLTAPLFAPDRRPGSARLAAAGADAAQGGRLDGYAAVGVAVGRGLATAVIAAPGGGVKTLRLGESLDGWRLAALDAGRVVFVREAERQTLVVGAPPATPAGFGSNGLGTTGLGPAR